MTVRSHPQITQTLFNSLCNLWIKKRNRMKIKSLITVVMVLTCLPLTTGSAQRRQQKPAIAEARRRADALLAQMSLEEKLGQMNQLFFFGSQPSEPLSAAIRNGQVGSLLFISDPAVINRLQKLAVTESRLKIPLLFGFDVIHGFHTIFPVP